MRGQAGCAVRQLLRLIQGHPEEKLGMYVTMDVERLEKCSQGCRRVENVIRRMFSPWFPSSSFFLQYLRLESREVNSWASRDFCRKATTRL